MGFVPRVAPKLSLTVLNSTSNAVFRKVEDFDEQINMFKAEELLRADLVQANYKGYLARINKKFNYKTCINTKSLHSPSFKNRKYL